jgi:predicted kinase
MRGLPGSGKSYLANSIAKTLGHIICSADYYWIENGEYKFDINKLKNAHDFCYNMAKALVVQEKNIIIDNTNTTKNEYQKYLELAFLNKYDVKVEIANFNGSAFDEKTKVWNIRFLLTNNKHNVPYETLVKMAKRFEW